METKSSFAEGAEAFTSYDKSKRNPYHKSDMNAYDWNLGYSAAKKAYKEGIAAHYDGDKGFYPLSAITQCPESSSIIVHMQPSFSKDSAMAAGVRFCLNFWLTFSFHAGFSLDISAST
jgi:hypothetical protein